jgi:hypothetical protein
LLLVSPPCGVKCAVIEGERARRRRHRVRVRARHVRACRAVI